MREQEQLVIERGRRSGALMAVAIDSTLLGPALGGARLWHYPDQESMVADVTALASAMTLKAAVAGLALGGGKGVISSPTRERPAGRLRRAILEDFGDLVDGLGGAYITAEDVGTGAEDMEVIATRTPHVVGRAEGSGDPSPVTALGVLSAMRACAARMAGRSNGSLGGLEVCLVGLGHVGASLARQLAAEGAALTATDIDPAKRRLADELGARWVDPGEAMTVGCDILAPCALGGAVTAELVPRLGCRAVCGAANNILAEHGVADLLMERGIDYAPDFVANAGGLISVYGELHSLPAARALDLARRVEATVADLLDLADRNHETPVAAAERLAGRRLAAAQAGPGASIAPELATLRDS